MDKAGSPLMIMYPRMIARSPQNHFGFYGFAHEKYLEDGLITVRVWVIASPAQFIRAQNGFPLDLQSMGCSPSKGLAFRLFNGRLSLLPP